MFKAKVLIILIALSSFMSVSGATAADQPGLKNALAEPYPAPAITGITAWLKTEPLTMEQLKGKVVLVDFWTYSCINCIRTFPYIKAWHEKYKYNGLIIIGIHAPEFDFENKQENVEKALKKFGITYPVAMDNNFITWKNFKNRYWPAHYLIDRDGQVVYTHFGEGHYDTTEHNIRFLLGLQKAQALETGTKVTAQNQTPETYLGTARAKNETNMDDLPLHHWRLDGEWNRGKEHIESAAPGASLTLHYRAKKVFLVMESADGNPKTVRITQNGKELELNITESQLYDIIINPEQTENTVTITAQDRSLRMFAFTFES